MYRLITFERHKEDMLQAYAAVKSGNWGSLVVMQTDSFNSLKELDIEAVKDLLEIFLKTWRVEYEPLENDSFRCYYCHKSSRLSSDIKHTKRCPVTKAKAILKQLEGV